MKKYITLLICLSILAGVVSCSSCSSFTSRDDVSADSSRLSIVTTIFPEYDWVKEILGDYAAFTDITMLLDNGVDLHSYQPTADDIIKISSCDIFIYVGGESDSWVDDILRSASNDKIIAINLLDILGDNIKEEEIIDGMEADEDTIDGNVDENAEDPEYDEHVWLSLKNAEILCQEIAKQIAVSDSENSEYYLNRANNYIKKLNELDAQYQTVVENASRKTILFGDRFPFRYLVDDYGLEYYAAFVGCSAETEASFETISFLVNKVDELDLPVILTIEGSQTKIAETIKNNSKNKNQQILAMDSMQSTTTVDVINGVSYLSIMESNLEILSTALN